MLDVFVNVWEIVEPEPAEAPVTDAGAETVQANVVPATVLVKATDVADPEQIVTGDGVAVTAGVGLTVMTTEIGVPVHPLAVGVIS
jgi:hypothetical protein